MTDVCRAEAGILVSYPACHEQSRRCDERGSHERDDVPRLYLLLWFHPRRQFSQLSIRWRLWLAYRGYQVWIYAVQPAAVIPSAGLVADQLRHWSTERHGVWRRQPVLSVLVAGCSHDTVASRVIRGWPFPGHVIPFPFRGSACPAILALRDTVRYRARNGH